MFDNMVHRCEIQLEKEIVRCDMQNIEILLMRFPGVHLLENHTVPKKKKKVDKKRISFDRMNFDRSHSRVKTHTNTQFLYGMS